MDVAALRTAVRDRGLDYLSDALIDRELGWAAREVTLAEAWPWRRRDERGSGPLAIVGLGPIERVMRVSDGGLLIPERPDTLIERYGERWWESPGAYYAAIHGEQRTNLFANPSGEHATVSTGSWLGNGSQGALDRYSGWATGRAYCVRSSGTISGSGDTFPGIEWATGSVRPGQRYTVLLDYNFAVKPANAVTMQVVARYWNGTAWAQTWSGVNKAAGVEAGSVRIVTDPLPADAQQLEVLVIYFANGANGQAFDIRVDRALCVAGAYDGEYFDGETAGCRWLGVKDASTSLDQRAVVRGMAPGEQLSVIHHSQRPWAASGDDQPSSSTDRPAAPEEFHELIALLAASRCAASDARTEQAQQLRLQAGTLLEGLQDAHLRRDGDEPEAIEASDGW